MDELGTDTTLPRGRARRLVILLLEIAAVGFVVRYLWVHADELRDAWSLDLSHGAALLALVAAVSLWRTIEFRTMLAGLAVRIGFGEAYALIQGAALLNHAPLNAGTVLRARSLKRHRSLSFTNYVAMMSAQVVTVLVASATLCLLAVLVAPPPGELQPWLIGASLAALVGPLAIFYLPPSLAGSGGRLRERFRSLIEGWQALGREPGKLALLLFMAAVKVILQGARFWVCFLALQMNVGPVDSVLFAAASSLAFLINITPAAIGLRELLVGGLAAATGFDFAVAVAAAGIDRVAGLIGAVVGGVPGLVYLARKYRSSSRPTPAGTESRPAGDSPDGRD